MDIGKKAPTPKPEDLSRLKGSPPPTPNDDDDDDGSDDDYYPTYRGHVQPDQDLEETVGEPSTSAISAPAAQNPSAIATPAASVLDIELAASGANTETKTVTDVIMSPLLITTIPALNRTRQEDEVSLGDDEFAPETMGPQILPSITDTDVGMIPEPMGPQIPILVEDTDTRMDVVDENDPLEFASSCLMLYGVPTSEEFTTIRNLISTIATRLDLTVRRILRVSDARSQSFWFEMESVDHARRMRTYMHHRRESELELLVSYANYDDFIKAHARSTHQWPNPITIDMNASPSASSLRPPAAGTSARRQVSDDRRRSRDMHRRSPSSERYGANRRFSPPSRRRSPTRSTYYRSRYQRSPSPRYRDRAPYRRSRSPNSHLSRSSRDSLTSQTLVNERGNTRLPTPQDTITPQPMPVPPLPVIPSPPANLWLPHDTPLPYGANLVFMLSPSGNTLSPVLLQGNATVIPYPLPPFGPTPSALLPWPVAATLPTPPISTVTGTRDDTPHVPLTSRITVRTEPTPESPPHAAPSSTLLSRMTGHLSDRLSDPIPQRMLAARLSEPRRTTLADRLETDNRMEIDHERTAESMNLRSPESLGNSRAPLTINADDRDSYSRASKLTPPLVPTTFMIKSRQLPGQSFESGQGKL
jgi:hypothetical protein